MYKNKTNTFFLIVFLILNIAYSTVDSSPTSLLGISMFGIMFIIIILSFFSTTHKFKNIDSIIFLSASICLTFHFLMTTTSIESIGLILTTLLFYIRLKYISINANATKIIIIIFLITIFFTLPELIQSLFTLASESSYKGIFKNPNFMGAFTTISITTTFLFVKNKKFKVLLLVLFILALMASKSRNCILFAISAIGFYLLLKSRFSKYAPLIFFTAIALALYYLIVIEPQAMTAQAQMFGKESGSAGRSGQILLTITRYPLTLFGVGYDIPNKYSYAMTGYPIHNFYINSLYALGIVFMCIYILFISTIYKNLRNPLAKSFLLSSHLYFLFEPGITFSIVALNNLPIILSIVSLNQEQNEHRTLYSKSKYRWS